jgi:hypothetical protein
MSAKWCGRSWLHKVGTLLKTPTRHSPFYKSDALCSTWPKITFAKFVLNSKIFTSDLKTSSSFLTSIQMFALSQSCQTHRSLSVFLTLSKIYPLQFLHVQVNFKFDPFIENFWQHDQSTRPTVKLSAVFKEHQIHITSVIIRFHSTGIDVASSKCVWQRDSILDSYAY